MLMSERFDKFTEGARKVLQMAQVEAQRFNHNYIGTEHLLLGLVSEGEGLAARVLHEMGVDLTKVRDAVRFIIGQGERTITGDIGLTPRAKRVMEFSVDEARRLNHNYIGTEHLLLGLLREGEGIAAGVLESIGIGLEAVRQAVTVAMHAEARGESVGTTLRAMFDQSRSPQHTPATTDPWPAFGAGLDVGELQTILADLDRLNEEIAYRRYASGPGYECGLVRFLPRATKYPRQISHVDKDVVCHVLEGRGELRTGTEVRTLTPGTLCRIPAGTPHDFTAVEEPLVLFYVSVSVG
jgi:mannose-6-phosphate isomerase-like protein (cupin superfamily)